MSARKRTERRRIHATPVWVIALGLSCGTTGVSAERRSNPFFPVSQVTPAAHSTAAPIVDPIPQRGPTAGQRPRRLPTVAPASNPHPEKLDRLPRPQSVLQKSAFFPGAGAGTQHSGVSHSRWLQSITSDSCLRRAEEHLECAYREYSVGAWASAEASAWNALELIATAIDVDERDGGNVDPGMTAAGQLRSARTAIREAREFAVAGGAIDGDRLIAIASSHQTAVFSQGVPDDFTAAEATDRYLDVARMKLTPLASLRVEAAQAMDLLAAVHLGRSDTSMLPEETALCLRRAALTGQPSNADLASRLGMQLADMGLNYEAENALRHSLELVPNVATACALVTVLERMGQPAEAAQLAARFETSTNDSSARFEPSSNRRVPDVVSLSPEAFAAISPAFNAGTVARPTATLSSEASRSQSTRPDASHAASFPDQRGQLPHAVIGESVSGTLATHRDFNGQSTAARAATSSSESTTDSRKPSVLNRLINKLPKPW